MLDWVTVIKTYSTLRMCSMHQPTFSTKHFPRIRVFLPVKISLALWGPPRYGKHVPHSRNVRARVSVFYSNYTHTWFHCVQYKGKCSRATTLSLSDASGSPTNSSQCHFIMDKFYYIALVLRRRLLLAGRIHLYTLVLFRRGSAGNELQLVRAGSGWRREATGLWLVSYRWEDLSEFAIHARPSGWVPFTILDIAFEMGETCVLPDDVCDWSLEWRRRSNQRDFLRSVINLEFSVRISLRATTFKEGRAVSHPRRNFCRLLLINVNPVNYIYTTIYYTYITSLLPHSRNRRK